ncbi:MAG TPA: hypothetical protein VGR32_10385 [Brevundimonas sp.]|jgi:RNase P subunit RPR2|uniref:hypothetical protein n=1 Tax=Brevundimonas sp. TaxID=1871086 RepID=UPI002DEDCA78|nr:hypothetical protein [Brevundimonas sp.]
MHRCRECHVILTEGRNWHASYAARTYRHCMECAKAYSRKRYGRLKPNVKRRVATTTAAHTPLKTARERVLRDRAAIARARREDRQD